MGDNSIQNQNNKPKKEKREIGEKLSSVPGKKNEKQNNSVS